MRAAYIPFPQKSKPSLLLVLVLLLGLCACTRELTPEETAQRLLVAVKLGDAVAAKKFVVKEDKAAFDHWEPIVEGEEEDIKILSCTVKDSTALVIYLDTGVKKELNLILENGKWKAHFVPPVLGPNPTQHTQPRKADAFVYSPE